MLINVKISFDYYCYCLITVVNYGVNISFFAIYFILLYTEKYVRHSFQRSRRSCIVYSVYTLAVVCMEDVSLVFTHVQVYRLILWEFWDHNCFVVLNDLSRLSIQL